MTRNNLAERKRLLLELNAHETVEFGKYQGEPIEVLVNDLPYLRWVLTETDLSDRYEWLEDFRELVG